MLHLHKPKIFRIIAQQSVHPTLGILARFQAFVHTSAFFQSDGVPPPAPARVTQTVRLLIIINDCANWRQINMSVIR
jgi:hypothetical protein